MALRIPRIEHTNLVRAAFALIITAAAAGCARQRIVMQPEPAPTAPAPLPPPPPRLPTVGALVSARPASVGMDSTLPVRLDSIIQVGLAEGAAPGAAVAVGRYGRLVYAKGYGTLDYAPDAPAVTPRTIYDLASLTKVVATTTSAMILEETGQLDLDKPVAFYVPEFNAPDKAGITVRMLLTHSGGLEAYAPLYSVANGSLRGRAEYLAAINQRPLQYPPGTQTVYSDWDMVLISNASPACRSTSTPTATSSGSSA
jgi:serine-type D-Ala-D-Ala carboxypeptidase